MDKVAMEKLILRVVRFSPVSNISAMSNAHSFAYQVRYKNSSNDSVVKQKTTIQAKYVYRNTEARSRNHCCRGKAISITYYKCVSIASVIQLTKCMGHIVKRGLSGCTIFYHTIL